MPELIYTQGFVEDLARVQLASKREEIFGHIDLLADFPELGSANVPESIMQSYGIRIRRLAANPFLIIYEYREDEDAVYLLGLDHQRTAW